MEFAEDPSAFQSLNEAANCVAGSIRLHPREVQVWGLWLDASDPTLAFYRSTLSLDERNRAQRFAFESLRRSYTLARRADCESYSHTISAAYPIISNSSVGLRANPLLKAVPGSASTLRIQARWPSMHSLLIVKLG